VERREEEDRPKILLVDDDRALTDVLCLALQDAGFEVRTAADGRAGWRAFNDEVPDLVVLDLLMPELDGLQLCRMIRERHATPIVMLTSRDEEIDKVLGLELGADDYVTKPFSTRELVARIRAALRRVELDRLHGEGAEPEEGAALELGELRLDRQRREVLLGETPIRLTSTEFELLWTLAERPGHVLARDQLIDRVYGEEVVVDHRTIDTFVKRLRHKLAGATSGRGQELIETVRGVGYRIRG
jgi:two-component system OmpR family response regulator